MNSQDVILGMLMKESLTGYEIKQLLENVFSNFFSSSYGTIYPTLTRMEKEELITKEIVLQDGKPNKNILNITDKGRACFNAYLQGPLKGDSIKKSDFMMRLYFGEFVGYDKIIIWLKQVQEDSQQKLNQLCEQYSLHKDEMHPAQIICIQIGIEEYKAKLETIAVGLVSMEQLAQE
ncbi:PadR family transcriptional regulator [Paenibacillus macquariensis]|uniref:DNA-binding transcriptional regulator, PadR family n=1 Tax=Paenibacillus macquariensis TaxID=948756 RepID=A0ABY1JPC7_9BACL|nr:PadR family transcriptional regulator [Paenibacillus macquariensis]MEC0092009.1 PadR family transcriptional regulator [Paenibacillus macquariensis]SIQ52792.1 DNA-binding transcriptional regulator, PadR family [Paenibacillus macquariensis]